DKFSNLKLHSLPPRQRFGVRAASTCTYAKKNLELEDAVSEFTCVLVCFSGQDVIQGRIVGGYAPAPYSIRYIVSIQSATGQHFCGGTLINKYWILTAAHCNIGAENMRIVAGDFSVGLYEGTEQFRRPHVLIPHPQYNRATNNADIMLIKVRQWNQCSCVTPNRQ
uniref:trypsin n=1 Tax=Cyprinus carpio TaxID=7962 RepID=A0A8C1GB11_CYPCA